MPLVSILIPTYQERDFIVACLESVRKFSVPAGWSVEIFVIDGGSRDGTTDLVKTFAARVTSSEARGLLSIQLLDNPRRLQSYALNLGIARAKGDYILRLDAHSEYPADYLARLIETAVRTGADNVGGRIRTNPRDDSYQSSLIQALTTHWFGVGNSFRTAVPEGPVDTVPFGFFKRDVFSRVGLFDERLVRAQDYEFNKRITMRGGVVWMNPDIILDYYQQPTMLKFLKKQGVHEAPYNAYMWYVAPYTFTPRHAVTLAFVVGLIVGIPLSFAFAWAKVILYAALGVYAALAIFAGLTQAFRYRRLAHVIAVPLGLFAYHVTHGVGVLVGVIRILLGAAPMKKSDPAWSSPSSRA